MPLKNTPSRYGAVTKTLHWAVFLLFLYQYIVAMNMVNMARTETALGGFSQDTLYNWHKSVGLVLLVLAFARYTWRRATPLPDWAPTLTSAERTATHWIERVLYLCMFLMPVAGLIYVMAGGYGVMLFGRWPLPNPLDGLDWLGEAGRMTHRVTAYVIVAAWLGHMFLVFKHQLVNKDRFLRRMLPFTHQ
jgi:cytochrome b561